MHLIYHVDDILLSFNNDEYGTAFKRALLTRFTGSDEGTFHRYLGIDITRDAVKLHMSQRASSIEVLERHGMLDCNPVSTPMDPGTTISPADCPQTHRSGAAPEISGDHPSELCST